MKINEITVASARVPRKVSFVTNLSCQNFVECVFVKLELDDGTTGYGETNPRKHITGETLNKTFSEITKLGKTLVGHDTSNILDLVSETENPATKLGYETALNDAIARSRNQPVYEILGGKCREYVKYAGFIGASALDLETMKRRGLYQKKLGYDKIRVKVGLNEKKDVDRIHALREAVGDDIGIWLDANEAWSTKEAVRILAKLKDANIMMIEQPVQRENISGMSTLCDMFDIPIMADESVHNASDISHIVNENAADAVNIKLIKTGTYSEMKKVIDIAKRANLEIYFGGTTCTDILSMYSRHIEMATPEITLFSSGKSRGRLLELDPVLLEYPEEGVEYSQPSSGTLYNLPGLAAKLDETILKTCIIDKKVFTI